MTVKLALFDDRDAWSVNNKNEIVVPISVHVHRSDCLNCSRHS